MRALKKTEKGIGSKSLAIVRKYFPKVTEVEDGDTKLQVEVTSADSKSAAVRNHEACAMAVACKRKFKADGVIVSISTAYIIKGKKAIRYEVPEAVQREIVSFDREAGFAPGEYELRPVPPTETLEELPHKTSGVKPHKVTGTPLRHYHHTAGLRAVLGSKEG
jgi:hypothetical protein